MTTEVSDTATEAPTEAAAPVAAPAAAAPAAPAAPAVAPEVKAEVKTETKVEGKADDKGFWPANWRETVSKDDAKVLARLQRYASPEAAMTALIEAQNRIARGELKPTLGKNATPEQVKEWREANGIPEAPDKYDLGEVAKAVSAEALQLVLAEAHATNQTPEQVKGTLSAWGKIQQTVREQRAEKDVAQQTAGEDALRQEWGADYRRHINLIHQTLDSTADQQLKDKVLNARLPDGTLFANSPEVLKFLAGVALMQNPTGVVVPGFEANPGKGVDDEIASIEKTMRENRPAYNKDEKMQARYRDLLEAREKLKPRAV